LKRSVPGLKLCPQNESQPQLPLASCRRARRSGRNSMMIDMSVGTSERDASAVNPGVGSSTHDYDLVPQARNSAIS